MKILTVFLLFLFSQLAFSQFVESDWEQLTKDHVLKLANDKEIFSQVLTKRQMRHLLEENKDEQRNIQMRDLLYEAIWDFIHLTTKQCEQNLLTIYKDKLAAQGFATDEKSLNNNFKLLRAMQAIDDILLEMLLEINNDMFRMAELDLDHTPRKLLFKRSEYFEKYDLERIFGHFKTWGDEVSRCSYREYMYAKNVFKKDFNLFLVKVQNDGIISNESYNKLYYLHNKSDLGKRKMWLSDYLTIIFYAKNSMANKSYVFSTNNFEKEDDFSSERIKRFSHLTRRTRLYNKYSNDQIVQLAQVLQKASRRMGVEKGIRPISLVTTETFVLLDEKNEPIIDESTGQPKTYVETREHAQPDFEDYAALSMRADIDTLQAMDVYRGMTISYEDVIMAGFETGYITVEEIKVVAKYDNLWNPETTRAEKIKDFVFKCLGYSTFYLPPPWNITASIAIGVASGVVDNLIKKGGNGDNTHSFFN